MANELEIDGKKFPCPSTLDYQGQQFVSGERNANGTYVGEKINRRQVRLDLVWNVVTPKEAQMILNSVEKHVVVVKFYDPKTGNKIKREMYWGDHSMSTYATDKFTGNPKFFTQLKTSLIDVGSEDLQ